MTSAKTSTDQLTRDRNLFKDTIWLSEPGLHDRYPEVPFAEYCERRATDEIDSLRKHAALVQSHLTFGLLESVMRIRVQESVLLRKEDSGRVIITGDNLHELLRAWQVRIRTKRSAAYRLRWAEDVRTVLAQAHFRLSSALHCEKGSFFLAGLP
ncbi:hypothetical protein EDC04DRAFT_58850 [Pisolithus marmoratus]|nr:hypothetical protein EDC04DRAFT_58850 [Pisolithus marmoratus]